MYGDGPPRVLTEAERQDPGRLDEDITDVSRKLLLRSRRLYCVRSATDAVVHSVRDGVKTSVSTDPVTRYRLPPVRSSHPLEVRTSRRQPSQKPLPVFTLPYSTKGKPAQSEQVTESFSLRKPSHMNARKQAFDTVLSSMAETSWRTHTSPPTC